MTTHLRWNLSSGNWMCELAITSLGVAVSPGRRRFFVSSWLSLVGLKLGVDISLCFPFYVPVLCSPQVPRCFLPLQCCQLTS